MRNQGRIAGECDGTRTDTLSGRISLGLGFSCEFELSTPLNGLGTTHLLLSLVVINLNTGKSLWLVLFPLWLDRWVILTVSLLKKIRPVMLCLTQRTCPGRRRLMTRREFRQPCVACLATCARVWISSSLLKTKPIVVSVYAKVCCGPYRLVFACVRMLEERVGGANAAMLPYANSSVSRLYALPEGSQQYWTPRLNNTIEMCKQCAE